MQFLVFYLGAIIAGGTAANIPATAPATTPATFGMGARWEKYFADSDPENFGIEDEFVVERGSSWSLRWMVTWDSRHTPYAANCVFVPRRKTVPPVPFSVRAGGRQAISFDGNPFRERACVAFPRFLERHMVIEIRRLRRSDSGKYTCITYSGGTTHPSKTLKLRVVDPPPKCVP